MRTMAIVMCIFLTLSGCNVGSFGGNVRSVARESACRARLHELYETLLQYIAIHGDLPRSIDGTVSLDGLVDPNANKSVIVSPTTLRCPADKNQVGRSYVLNSTLSIDDLRPESPVIVAFDRRPHHFSEITHNATCAVLLGDGTTVMMDISMDKQKEWRQLLESGDERACRVLSNDGTIGYWTSGNIMWYLGPKHGYVPND